MNRENNRGLFLMIILVSKRMISEPENFIPFQLIFLLTLHHGPPGHCCATLTSICLFIFIFGGSSAHQPGPAAVRRCDGWRVGDNGDQDGQALRYNDTHQ